MRPLFLATVLLATSLVPASAQSIPDAPTLTYPEPGTFCGVLKLCDESKGVVTRNN